MKIPLICLIFAVCLPSTTFAAVVLAPGHTADWLEFDSFTSTLTSNDGIARANFGLSIQNGTSYAGTLSPLNLASSHWLDTVPYDESGDPASAVSGLRIHVLPGMESTRFTFTFTALTGDLHGAILMLGGLDAGSDSMVSLAATSPDPAIIEWLGFGRWDPGFAAQDAPLIWNQLDSTLSADPNGTGETGFGFFRINGPGTHEISLEFASDHPAPLGDAFVAGLAIVTIPEPSITLLLLPGAIMLLTHRKSSG